MHSEFWGLEEEEEKTWKTDLIWFDLMGFEFTLLNSNKAANSSILFTFIFFWMITVGVSLIPAFWTLVQSIILPNEKCSLFAVGI